jgi:hypothetical protein
MWIGPPQPAPQTRVNPLPISVKSLSFDLTMNAFAPLLAVLILSIVLVTNFFFAAWRLGILRAFGRRHPISWHTVAAGTFAACLPFAGALLALALIPADNGVDISQSAGQLALQLAFCGLLMHLANDQLVAWGRHRAGP